MSHGQLELCTNTLIVKYTKVAVVYKDRPSWVNESISTVYLFVWDLFLQH